MIIDDLFESPQLCPECGGISFSDLILAEKKDACYYKVKASAKVWPSAYASGRLVQCRKKGAGNYGNKSEGVAEGSRTPQDWEVKSAVWGLDKRGVHQEPQNIKSHFVRADRSSRAEEKAKREYEPGRGTWEIHPRGNKQQGVAEGSSDTIYPNAEVIKSKNGKPVGEIYQDGNSWGAFHYRADRGYDFIDSREEAIEALRDLHQETGRSRPDYTVKGVAEEGYGNHPSQRVDPRTGKKYVPPKSPLGQGVAEATGDQKFDSMMSRITAEPKYPDRQMPPTSIPELIQWADQNNKPYHKFFAQWAQKHRFTNVNDALVWVGDNVDPYDEFGPKDHEDAFGDLVGEPLIDAAKHNPKAAELLKVFKCYEEIIDDWDDEYRQMSLPENQLDEKSVSQAQFRTMAAAAHNPKFARKVGISQDVAREFNKADKGSNYKKLPARTTEGALVTTTPGSINPGGAVDNFKQQMANNTEVAYQKKLSGVGEGEQQKGADYRDPPEADYGDDYQDMVARVKKLAGLGPLKTVYDPAKRVYRNIPTAVQPKK